jgi:DNA-binding response OmpR family regulator
MAARIVVVDDDPAIRDSLTILLEARGYDVRSADSGDRGVSLAREFQPDIVMTDIIMPGVEGIETIMTLKRQQPQIRIIAMSGGRDRGGRNYLELARKMGADRSLEKPFDESALLEAIQSLCGSHSAATD